MINKLDIRTPGREEVEVETAGAMVLENGSAFEEASDFDLVVAGLGGRENIDTITNCFTRLRVTVKDQGLVDPVVLEKISQQKGIVLNGKNVQVIIGMGVQTFKDDICEKLGIVDV